MRLVRKGQRVLGDKGEGDEGREGREADCRHIQGNMEGFWFSFFHRLVLGDELVMCGGCKWPDSVSVHGEVTQVCGV